MVWSIIRKKKHKLPFWKHLNNGSSFYIHVSVFVDVVELGSYVIFAVDTFICCNCDQCEVLPVGQSVNLIKSVVWGW